MRSLSLGTLLSFALLAASARPMQAQRAVGTKWRITMESGTTLGMRSTFVEFRALDATGRVISFGEIAIDRSTGNTRPRASLRKAIRHEAEFTGYPTLGVAPHTVDFEDLSSNGVSSWSWDFGDGAMSSLANPSHTYAATGTYDVRLTVTGLRGSDTKTKVGFVSIVAPTATPFDAWTLEATRMPSGNPLYNPKIQILDLNLGVVMTFEDPLPGFGFSEISKPLSNGRLLALIYDRETGDKRAIELAADGTVLWQHDPGAGIPTADIQRLASGNTLILTYFVESWPDLHGDPILNEYITEIDPGGNVVWKWGMAQNWSRLPFSPSERALLNVYPGPWIFHTNSMGSLPANRWEAVDPRFAEGNVIVSLRETNKVFIISRQTGMVVWSYGGAVAQHHARMIPAGLPGAGNILLFDNGGTAGAPPVTREFSRLLEIDPTTNEVVWSYEDPATFYSTRMGSVQRMPNGNTFFTEGENGVLKEIDPGGVVLWTHVRSAPERIFRGYRVGFDWSSPTFTFDW